MEPGVAILLSVASGLIALAIVVLALWRRSDLRHDARVRATLVAAQPGEPLVFAVSMVKDLPEPVRRYFLRVIRLGTPLYTVAEIAMHGEFSLGSRRRPNYMRMRAHQTLGAPEGFVWQATARSGAFWVSGSDGALGARSWSRFRLLGFIPVARAGGSRDHLRASFGRFIAEAAFWTPAALLPREGVDWVATGADSIRVAVTVNGLHQLVELTLDRSGQPVEVKFSRWTDANPEKQFRYQLFGGFLSEHRDFRGFHLPTRIEAGNHFGSEEYFPFFRASVSSITFPKL